MGERALAGATNADEDAGGGPTPGGRAPRPAVATFWAIGTHWRILTPRPLPAAALAGVLRVIEGYDRAFSRFREDSTVHAMMRRAGAYPLPPCAGALFDLYGRLGALTSGAVNPLVGASLVHLGYDERYGLRPAPGFLPAPRFEELCAWDGEVLRAREPVTLDVGAAGKGQLADLVLAELGRRGIDPEGDVGVTVDAGGDIVRRAGAGPAVRVGLEDPRDPARVIGAAAIGSGAACASAPNRRAWRGVHHILDARTGRPTSGIAAAWATAGSAMLADGAATALFFAEPARVARELGVGALALYADRTAAWEPEGRFEVFA